MNHPYPHLPPDGPIAYVREADPEGLPPGTADGPHKLYAIHDASGNRLAVVPDRDLAFAVVRRNDMVPVSVH